MSRHRFPRIFLKPGELFFAQEPSLITTLLGSCVTVTMYNPRVQAGAICHGLLPECGDDCDCDALGEYRFVDCAIRSMLKRFATIGVLPMDLEVKVFGGADMFDIRPTPRRVASVGELNINKARQVLESEGLRITAHDVGGDEGRQIYFYTDTGEVLLRRLGRAGRTTGSATSNNG
ncbi:MAG TPA: chemotaxis protein CheD [Geobacterales bacterium]|jgi:chemotaxis protein CheD|nr:chemotaxis protein CheD [Geobacterales bacterium]